MMQPARKIGGIWLGAAALAFAAGLALAADAPTAPLPAPPGTEGTAAAEEDCSTIDFEAAEMLGKGPDLRLHVTGTAPRKGLRIRLIPVMYVMQPEYWQLVLVGCAASELPAGAEPFDVELPLAGSIGRKGVLLVGRSPANEKRFDLVP